MAFDTSPRISKAHLRLYREIGETGRARIAAEMTDLLRDLAVAGVKHRHPEYGEEQVLQEVLAIFLLPPVGAVRSISITFRNGQRRSTSKTSGALRARRRTDGLGDLSQQFLPLQCRSTDHCFTSVRASELNKYSDRNGHKCLSNY